MNLVCPPGSYDANVEPAKDDVLFTDSLGVLDVVERFFKSIYGELGSKEKSTSKGKTSVSKSQAFDLLLRKRKSPAAMQPTPPDLQSNDTPGLASQHYSAEINVDTSEPPELIEDHGLSMDERRTGPRANSSAVNETISTGTQSSPIHHSTGTQHIWQQSMYEGDDPDELPEPHAASQDHDIDNEEDLRDVRIANPWTFAKLNAPLRPRNHNGLSGNGQLLTPAKHHDGMVGELSSPLRMDPAATSQAALPSPEKSDTTTPFEEPSDDSFPYPLRRWGKAHRGSASRPNPLLSDDALSSSLLDTWMQRPSALPEGTSHEGLFIDEHDTAMPRPRGDFVLASELPQGTPLSRIPDISQKPARKTGLRKQRQTGNVNKPFKTAVVHDEERVWYDHLGPSSSAHSPKKKTAQQSRELSSVAYQYADGENNPILGPSSSESQHPGLALTMDYESRKAAATAQRRAFLREQAKSRTSSQRPEEMQGTPIRISPWQQSEGSSPQQQTQIKISSSQQSQPPFSSSPHRNRYNAAVAALRAPAASTRPAAGEDKSAPAVPPLDPKDPRAYLLRTLSRPAGAKNVRVALMPLETSTLTADGGGAVRELQQICDTSALLAPRSTKRRLRGGQEGFEDARPAEIKAWEDRVRGLVAGFYGRGD
ncbi:MAG: hypothetical protein LQ352_006605, partial [Teloschistes flavicans]